LDSIQSYSNFTLQNTVLERYLPKLRVLGVDVVFTASPLSMGLLRKNGVPIAELGNWHPAPNGLRVASKEATEWVEAQGDDLASLAVRFVMAKFIEVNERIPGGGAMIFGGCSSIWELEENLRSIQKIVEVDGKTRKVAVKKDQLRNDERLFEGVRRILGEWVDYSWASPGPNWVRKSVGSSSKI